MHMVRPVILIYLIICAVSSTTAGEILIVYTNNTNGMLENCRCPEQAYGALEKRAALIDSLRMTNKDLLLLDSGDILDIRPNRLLHEYILKAYELMKYDAWTPGDQDFVEGIGFFKNRMMTLPMTMVSANLRIDEKRADPLWTEKVAGGIRFGITGVISRKTIRFLPDSIQNRLEPEEISTSLGPVLAKLDADDDFIILLSHGGVDHDRELAAHFPQIGLIIGGHSQTIIRDPEKVNNALIVQAGEGGNRTGILHLVFENGKLISYANKLYLLQKNDRDDPRVMELIRAYHKERLGKMKPNFKK
jgi:5'-nucleotidase/UDP-sugar diphosphatase